MTSLSIKPTTTTGNYGLQTSISLPASRVVSTSDVKKAMRVDFSEDDDFIESLIESATLHVMKLINRALISPTSIVAEWDSVGSDVPLPYYTVGVTNISSVKVVSAENVETELTLNTGYFFRNGVITVSTDLGLKVTYDVGYGVTSATVPRPIRTAIERIVLGLYDRRDDEILETNIDQLALNSMSLLNPYINHKVW